MIRRIFGARRGPIILGLLAGAVALVFLSTPRTSHYSSDGFGIFGRVQIKCGSSFDDKVGVAFDDFAEGQSYRSTVISYGEPNIFEGKTATQVCKKSNKDARIAAGWIGGVGALLFVIGVNRLNKTPPIAPTFNPVTAPVARPAPSAGPSTIKSTTPTIDNPARWASDPFGRYDLRFWNGKKWTEHVGRNGQQLTDPPKPQAEPVRAGFAPPSLDHDGHTIRRSSPTIVSSLTLMLSTGLKVDARGLVTIGRGPSTADGAQPVTIDGPLLSRSHLRIGTDANGPWVEDTHSTNGVELLAPDGRTSRVAAGVRTPVPPGTRIAFGDSWCDVVVGTT